MMPKGTVMLTHYNNLIVGMQRKGIYLKKDEDIYAGVNQYAIHCRVACQIENTDCVAYGYNIASLEEVGLVGKSVVITNGANNPVPTYVAPTPTETETQTETETETETESETE